MMCSFWFRLFDGGLGCTIVRREALSNAGDGRKAAKVSGSSLRRLPRISQRGNVVSASIESNQSRGVGAMVDWVAAMGWGYALICVLVVVLVVLGIAALVKYLAAR